MIKDGFYNIMIVGVGGQGVMTMGKFFREYAMRLSHLANLISIENRGVSQREGSTYCLIRYFFKAKPSDIQENTQYIAPVPSNKSIDLMIALEPLEMIRNLQYIHPKASIFLNNFPIVPKSSITDKRIKYPDISSVIKKMQNIYPYISLNFQNYTKIALNKNEKSIYANNLILQVIPDFLPDIFEKDLFNKILSTFFQKY
ncbi:2-oxoacid:acceptor oxidoreductase family protein [Promethearchaeum syntrophicum]|uniref:2-oxoacid:acceptor oxidoreductase family protein n=1 Tax=Promethearchaeum syntrophicum TaxID=2594042 RepID=A0A5B9DCD9_9ARCH|nr:2-oxoacid:acceptor oxidoreductase family protein [Candidatus Prometheoarchaeum syntrophicum]QEE16537.1 Indolepyruvate oxidoreductase subunit IorB [Candidatus Prometheoarchaeum syntrophicum]